MMLSKIPIRYSDKVLSNLLIVSCDYSVFEDCFLKGNNSGSNHI